MRGIKSIASDWKKELRWHLLEILTAEDKSTLIDIGAGTGVHAKFFHDQGLDVTCIDLSPATSPKMFRKSLNSTILNVINLNSHGPGYMIVILPFNSLLDIPTLRLPNALSNISNILKPDSLFFWGQYGGEYREGVYQDDHHDPKRFFSLLNDDQINEFTLDFLSLKNSIQ